MLLGEVRQLEVEREGAQDLRLLVEVEFPDGARQLGPHLRVAGLARPPGDRGLLFAGEQLLPLLLDHHAPEQVAEEADVPAERRVGRHDVRDYAPCGRCFRTPTSSPWTMRAPRSTAPGSWRRTASSSRWATGPPPFAEHFENLGGALVTPGLVNTHHHLYQTLTRTRAQEADLFTWLRTLYPLWGAGRRRGRVRGRPHRARGARARRLHDVFDHHYVFPPGRSGLVEAEIQAARELGVRIVASRGSMDVGESDGGLPPDDLVEDMDAVLADTEGLFALHEQGPAPGRRSRSRPARRSRPRSG